MWLIGVKLAFILKGNIRKKWQFCQSRNRDIIMTARENLIMIDGWEYVHCPVCGKQDICDECGWQNTGETNIDGGPNKMTLAEAKKAYANSKKIL